MTEPTWEEREHPILQAIALMEERDESITNESVAAKTGLDEATVGRAVSRLHDAGFLRASDETGMGDKHPVFVHAELRERGLRAVGQWPPEVADAFIHRLDALIAMTTDPDERSRLRKLKTAAAEVSKGVVSGAIVAAGQWGVGVS